MEAIKFALEEFDPPVFIYPLETRRRGSLDGYAFNMPFLPR
jgi:hypothetical protein